LIRAWSNEGSGKDRKGEEAVWNIRQYLGCVRFLTESGAAPLRAADRWILRKSSTNAPHWTGEKYEATTRLFNAEITTATDNKDMSANIFRHKVMGSLPDFIPKKRHGYQFKVMDRGTSRHSLGTEELTTDG